MKKLIIFALLLPLAAFSQKGRPQRVVVCSGAGSATAATCTPSPALAALSDLSTTPRMQVHFTPTANNTGALTLAISGLTATSVVKYVGGAAQALAANDLRAATSYILEYDGTNFVVKSLLGNAGAGGSESTTVANSGASGASVLKTGTNVTGRKLMAGSNVTITENTDDITIAASSSGGSSITRTAVTYSATPTFTRSSAIQQFTMTFGAGNVTSSTLSGASAGDLLSFELTQDGTGSRTIAMPTGFPALTICASANSRTTVQYFWTGSAAILRSYQTSGCGAPAILTDAGNVIDFPDANGTVATIAGAQTLINKSLTAPILTNGTNGHCVQKNSSTGALETSGATCGGSGGGGSLSWAVPIGTRFVVPSVGGPINSYAISTADSTNFNWSEYHGVNAESPVPYVAITNAGTARFVWATHLPAGFSTGNTLSLRIRRTFESPFTGTVPWSVRTVCPSTMPALSVDFSWNTAATNTETVSAGFSNTDIVTGIPLTGCAAGSLVLIQVQKSTGTYAQRVLMSEIGGTIVP